MLYTYDPKSLIITFKGRPITGFGENSVLKISRADDMFKEKVGCSGEVGRSKTNNRSGTAEITLMQTSPDNDYLSSCAVQDEAANAGVGELSAKDVLGKSYFFSSKAYVKKMADGDYQKELTDRVWVLFCADLNIFIAGNVPQL